jgi:hypothetical protein
VNLDQRGYQGAGALPIGPATRNGHCRHGAYSASEVASVAALDEGSASQAAHVGAHADVEAVTAELMQLVRRSTG